PVKDELLADEGEERHRISPVSVNTEITDISVNCQEDFEPRGFHRKQFESGAPVQRAPSPAPRSGGSEAESPRGRDQGEFAAERGEGAKWSSEATAPTRKGGLT